jgi:hypothetical protein
LIRAEDFHAFAAALRQHGLHGAFREFRRIAVAAEVAKHHAFDLPGQQLLDYTRRSRVREMPVPRHDALLHRPRPILAGLEQLLVVVGFDDERVHFAQALDQHLRRVTEIGDEPEPALPAWNA